jgi:hypothetical protein
MPLGCREEGTDTVKPVALTKLDWLDRAIQVHNYHAGLCKEQSQLGKKWTIVQTAEMLNRSVGSVSQDITVAQWAKTHDRILRKYNSMRDALDFIRQRKQEMRHSEIEID